jgi:hypothetical protein
MPAEATNTVLGLPVTAAQLTDAATVIGLIIAGLAGYGRAKKPADSGADAKTVAVAMAAPLGDPNQLRQVVEALNRLNDYAPKILVVLDDIKDGLERNETAIGRVEEAANRAGSAARDVDATLNRQART